MLQRLIKFIKVGIWQIPTETLHSFKAFWVRFLRVALLVTQGFTRSQVQQGASSLTYYTLLSLVPTIALLVGLARGFSLEESFHQWLLERFSSQVTVINQLFTFAEASLKEVRQGLIASLGVVILFWSAVKILVNIEHVMNEIWEVQRPRTLAKQFSDYLAMMVICPLIIFVSSSMTVYLSARLAALKQHGGLIHDVGPLLFPILNLIPYLLTCALFTFIYIFMPNTNVRLRPALYAGLIAGIIYQIVQWAYLYFQIGVTSYNAIYGTFAALPLFLIWIHLSWVILLLGAKMAFALQNVDAYEFVTEDFKLSYYFRQILSLRIAHLCIRQFCDGKPPLSKISLSNQLVIPLVLTTQLLGDLVQAGLLNEVQREKDEDTRYQPALDPEQLTIKRILELLEAKGGSIPLPPTPEVVSILKRLEEFSTLVERSDANVLLKNI